MASGIGARPLAIVAKTTKGWGATDEQGTGKRHFFGRDHRLQLARFFFVDFSVGSNPRSIGWRVKREPTKCPSYSVEDAFDLCRYYNVLVEAPHGKACAYKEMGKCPAPCDGSISLEQYRRLVDWSLATLIDPAQMIRQQTQRMQLAASDLKFEAAAKIKAYIEQLSSSKDRSLLAKRRKWWLGSVPTGCLPHLVRGESL